MNNLWTSSRMLFVSVALLLVGLTGCSTVGPGQSFLLLVPNYGEGTIQVLTPADRVDGGNASSAWSTDSANGYTGLAYGPDGRLYIADYTNDAIVVVDGSNKDASGTIAPAAVITHPDLSGPMGASFDSNGDLWIGTYSSGVAHRFDVAGVTGNVQLAPSLTLSVDTSGGALAFDSIYDVFVDHQDNVWVTDYYSGVYRFEGVAALSGTASAAPALFLEEGTTSTVSDSGTTLAGPISLWVDANGTLYVGSYDFHEISRFDNALSLTGNSSVEASAYIDTGIQYPYMVTLDASGALWVGHYNGELARLANPDSYVGNVDVSGDIDPELSWYLPAGTGYPDGGTLKFIPQ